MSTLTPLEERLTAALAARAEQVQPHHLRDAPAPTPGRGAAVVPLRRRRIAVALAAAAAAAAVAAPFVWNGLGDDADQSPTPAPSPSVETPDVVPDDVGADWGVVDRTRLDLDGDGTPEPLRLRDSSAGVGGLPSNPARVDTVLSSTGALVYGTFDNNGTFTNFFSPATIDADSDGSDEAVLYRPDDQGVGGDLVVIDLVGDYLVEVPRDQSAPLSVDDLRDDSKPERDGEYHAFATARWVQDGTLYSSRSVESYATAGPATYSTVPTVYRAQVWAWRIVEGRLVPEPQPESCVDTRIEPGLPPTRPCADGESDALPQLFPRSTEVVTVGGSAPAIDDLDFDGRLDTIALEGTLTDGAVAEDGDVELVLTLSSFGEKRLPLPAGGAPEAYLRTVSAGMLDGIQLLVGRTREDFTEFSFVYTGGEGFAGPLAVREAGSGRMLVSGEFEQVPSSYRTWMGPDGALYTAIWRGVDQQSAQPSVEAPAELVTWVTESAALGGLRLRAVPVGNACIDLAAQEATRC